MSSENSYFYLNVYFTYVFLFGSGFWYVIAQPMYYYVHTVCVSYMWIARGAATHNTYNFKTFWKFTKLYPTQHIPIIIPYYTTHRFYCTVCFFLFFSSSRFSLIFFACFSFQFLVCTFCVCFIFFIHFRCYSLYYMPVRFRFKSKKGAESYSTCEKRMYKYEFRVWVRVE